MGDLWRNLVPLVLGSAIVPAPLLVTILLLRSSARTAAAWLAGMTVVRLIQGALFGLVFSSASTPATETAAGREAVVAAVLLVLSVTLFVTAARQLLGGGDPDEPPPKWMAMVDSVGAGAGETVYVCRGKEASFAFLPDEVATEATVVAIVDEGQRLEGGS